MLKKINTSNHSFKAGTPVFIVTKEGEILEGYYIESCLFELVSLNKSPLSGNEKQGFTIDNEILRPNWCAGKKMLVAACLDKEKAQILAKNEKEKIERRIMRGGKLSHQTDHPDCES